MASERPYDSTRGLPNFCFTSRYCSTVIGADPQRSIRTGTSVSGGKSTANIREKIVGTPVTIVGLYRANHSGMSSALKRPASAMLAPARSGARIWLLIPLV